MKKPEISIIITTYNRANYLKSCIESVLNQTIKDFELIIIDYGSTDNTKEVVAQYQDRRINYIYQKNNGQNSARNKGLELAKGEYIAYIDSDDIWNTEKLEKQHCIMKNHPDISVVYCGTRLINENGEVIGEKPLVSHRGFVLDKLIFTNFLYNGSCVLFKKECINKAGIYDESLNRMTDWDFYLRLALYYKFYGINEYLLDYRTHSSTMSSDFQSYEKCGIRIIEKIFSHKAFDKRLLKHKKRAIALRYNYMARRYLENNLNNRARDNFIKALEADNSIFFHNYYYIFLILSLFPKNISCSIKNLIKAFKFRATLARK